MKKSEPIQITFPKPCHEDWGNMTSADKGRFCNSCQKNVIDLSMYTDEKLHEFLIEHRNENICARLKGSQLGRSIVPASQTNNWLHKLIAASGLALMFTLAGTATSFAQAPLTQHTATYEQSTSNNKNHEPQLLTIKGKVVDKDGAPIPYAIARLSLDARALTSVLTNEHGDYTLVMNTQDFGSNLELNVIAKGFHLDPIYLFFLVQESGYLKSGGVINVGQILLPDAIEEFYKGEPAILPSNSPALEQAKEKARKLLAPYNKKLTTCQIKVPYK